ncbi:hypothetical protein HGRIS_000225 [Hohenbuehelia grisea]|uniref:F-box domain-containing protein n=1 Tax=Hohenbuehelia grisea TaxID=104357 RepID=A0ABR3JSC0_9AGAR
MNRLFISESRWCATGQFRQSPTTTNASRRSRFFNLFQLFDQPFSLKFLVHVPSATIMDPSNSTKVESKAEPIDLFPPTTPLDPAQALSVKTILSQHERDLAVCEAEIERLICRRRELRTSVERFKSALAPIQNMPTEILLRIMELTLGSGRRISVSEPRQLLASPWVFGLICRRWRYIALSAPTLWCRLAINPYSLHYHPWTGASSALDNILSRSSDQPLDILVIAPDELHTFHSEMIPIYRDIYNVLIPHSSRWERIEMPLPLELWGRLSHVKNHVPMLKSVSLQFVGVVIDGFFMDAFEIAPLLTSFKTPNPWKHFKLPWHQMEHMQLQDKQTSILDLLDLARSVTTLAIFPTGPSPSISRQVHLPTLKSLKLLGTAADMINNITSPSLSVLSIFASQARSARQIIDQSSCRIQDLEISLCSTRDKEQVIDLLKFMPDLEILRIDQSLPCADILRALHWKPGQKRVHLPKLHTLSVQCKFGKLTNVFLDLVENRATDWSSTGNSITPTPAKLEKLLIRLPAYSLQPSRFKERLSQLRRRGILHEI